MLREIEVRNLRVKDVLRDDNQRWAAICLHTSKTDQQGEGIRRTLSCCGKQLCEPHCPWRLAMLVVGSVADKLVTAETPLFMDSRGRKVSKQGVVTSWKRLFGAAVTGHSPRRSGAMFYVRRGMAIQELAFLGRWRSSVVLNYAEEALQEKPCPSLDSWNNQRWTRSWTRWKGLNRPRVTSGGRKMNLQPRH